MDSYLFVRVVGKGSYGEVNLVRHKSDRKQYVIKKLNLRTSSRRERRAAEQEAQLLSQLKHPNIVTYRESWEGEDCQLYIVMGFCEGGDLYHRLKQQKGELLPERQVVEWFVQIAMALQYLHEKHILHRDLKTQNIFLTKTNIIKVGDLGIARVLENQNDMASTLIGTPYYMSPELFSNKPYNYKSDIWALGCCVYEMATLKHAFNAKDMNSLVYRIVEGKLPQMPSRYDPQLGELIKRMLCKKPEDRPDVKHILRQPYIKHQISMFLEATKEKTAKSRKNAVNSKPSAGSDGSTKPNHEVQPQYFHSESKTRRKKVEENHLNRQKLCNGVVENVVPNPPLPPKSPSRDILNSTGQSIATISNIDIEIQSQKQRKAKPPQPKPSSHQNHKPPSVSKKREKDEKEDPSPPQTHPLKQEFGVSRTEDKMSANELISESSNTAKPADRTNNKALDASMDLKDDTMKLLQEAGVEDIPYEPTEQHHNAERKSESQRTSAAVDDNHSNACVLKDVPTGSSTEESEGSLDSTEKLLKPVPVILMEPCNSESTALSDQSRPVLLPSSSSSEPSMSRQRRQRKKDKSLDDQNSHQVKAVPRPLPPLPEDVLSINSAQKGQSNSETNRPTNLSSKNAPEQQNRPLSARERRRLKQLQENSRQQVSAVKRAPCDVPSLDSKQTDQIDCPRPVSTTLETKKERKSSWRQSDEDECSSSTSSTERSEGDYRERKCETNEMQDLVQMMTQTLHMDARDVSFEPDGLRCHSTPLPEFKLNRKYRDTLMLHGKSREGQGDFQISGFPLDDSTGPAKVRRVIEHLRTDVVKGLGVKLLDRVLDIMQEEDEVKREHLLQEQMGEEKYKQYAVKVRQLKFFEDVAFKD
ncbi:serine/threonine-protein kinase Nek4 isoform X2 [Ctenopharyngodon idella]|uniref:serine/threonine-protein kinase Nek4 isoform X2 n=1 Tax=Ctenopharyngodon idella TaxID=7959 RepID=UPI002231BE94|nr:serine/threonine-protein kinase Nek4 isoform X2 [Ctenopharyngodon idella]